MTSPTEWLAEHVARGATVAEALAFFDRCAPVTIDEMLGRWRGGGLPTGHLLDGLLEQYGWYGKRFSDADHVDPLLFARGRPGAPRAPFAAAPFAAAPFAVAPRLMPLGLAVFPRLARSTFARRCFDLLLPLLRTSHSAARLRLIEYRGRVTATMIYDHLPIHDVFRRVDEQTLIGLMDQRGALAPFFFVLRRDAATA